MFNLIGKKVVLQANDFLQKKIIATVAMISPDNKSMLLNLDESLLYGNIVYKRVITSPRVSKDDLDVLSNDGVLGCSAIWVPESKYNNRNPFDISWWRGGAAAITDMSIL